MALTKTPIELSSTPGIEDNSNATAITIDSSENVGIGTSSPARTLHSKGGSGISTTGKFEAGGSQVYVQLSSSGQADGDSGYIGYDSSKNLTLFTDNTERMRIDSSGNVQQGNYSDTTVKNFNMRSTKAIFNIAVDGATNAAGTTLSYSWANGGQGPLKFSDASSERMRIDSSGKVGIGTASPTAKLTVSGTGVGAAIDWTNTTASTGRSYRWVSLNNGTGFAVEDLTAASERMRINSSGDLLVGCTGTPSASVAGVMIARTPNITSSRSATTTASPMSHWIFYNSNGVVGSISTSGGSTVYATSSDYRLKTDAQPMTGATARLKALNPVNFEWIADGTRVDGFIAHEAQEVVPECVTGEKDAMMEEEYEVTPAVLDEEGNTVEEVVMGTRSVPDYQGIDQSKLVPLLVATIQELEARITQLENN